MSWFSKYNFAWAIFTLFTSSYTIAGARHLLAYSVPHPGEFANFIKKMLMPEG